MAALFVIRGLIAEGSYKSASYARRARYRLGDILSDRITGIAMKEHPEIAKQVRAYVAREFDRVIPGLHSRLFTRCPVRTGAARRSIRVIKGTTSALRVRMVLPLDSGVRVASMGVYYAPYITDPWFRNICQSWFQRSSANILPGALVLWARLIEQKLRRQGKLELWF